MGADSDEIPQVTERVGGDAFTTRVIVEDASGNAIDFPASEARDLATTLLRIAEEWGA